jgi:hypothetical protein
MQSSLELAPDPLCFEATIAGSVFFDDGNHQLIAFRLGKMSGLLMKCEPNNMATTALCLDLDGPQAILAIKFSLDNKLMAIQRYEKIIEIYRYDIEHPELITLLVKKQFRDFILIDFVWINKVELLIVTKKQIEIYRVVADTRHLEPLRNFGSDISWYKWCKVGHLALVASQNGAVLTPYVIKQSDTHEKLAPLKSKLIGF